jgi:hypothetical protein
MTEENINREDLIDLPPIKKITVQFLHFIFSIIDQLVDVLRKSKILILSGLISGAIAGYLYYSTRTPYFQVTMIAESSSIYRKTLAEMIKSLNNLIISQSYDQLAKELGVTEPHVRKLGSVQMTSLQDESLENDTSTKYSQPFKIVAHINQTELTDTFQNAIANYLNNKSSFRKIKNEQIKFYKEKIAFIDKELAKLDTLKTEYNRFFASPKITTTYYSNDVDPSNIYKHANDLFNEKGSIMVWLSSDSNPIRVMDEFKSPKQPQSTSRFGTVLYGALIGLGINFLLGLYLSLYRKIRNLQSKF